MNLFKKGSLLTLACLLCFSLFSFKSIETNEKQLSNLENFNQVQINSNIDQPDKAAVTGLARAAGRLAVKAWQKSSREAVYAAVALWPLTRAKDNLVNLEIDNSLIQESKLAQL